MKKAIGGDRLLPKQSTENSINYIMSHDIKYPYTYEVGLSATSKNTIARMLDSTEQGLDELLNEAIATLAKLKGVQDA